MNEEEQEFYHRKIIERCENDPCICANCGKTTNLVATLFGIYCRDCLKKFEEFDRTRKQFREMMKKKINNYKVKNEDRDK